MAGLLDGKSALITGGGGGIGRATALAFAREGARVAVADAAEAAAQETVALINKAGGQAMSLTGDVTDAKVVEATVKSVVAAYGRLDCAFNNAGIAGFQVDAAGKKTADWSEAVVRPDDRGQPEGRVAVHEARADRRWWRRAAAPSSTPPRSPGLSACRPRRPMSPRSMASWG